jgi:nucleoside phosphorylase/CheY-like chemotaxis protein
MALDVLLLEDDPSKKNRLLEFLSDRKALFNRVDTALCTRDALRFMQSHQYDLLIADVVVPSELGGDKSEDHCISMFEAIDDGHGEVLRPRYALPISASTELTSDAHEFFRGRPWGILPYTEQTDECLTTVEKVARFVLSEIAGNAAYPACDVFIITALMEPEFLALEAEPFDWGPLEPLDSIHLIRHGSIAVDGNTIRVAAGFCSRMGPVAAAILATKVMLTLRPRMIVMGGICAGIPGKAKIGDVVAADLSWDWQSGKHTDMKGTEVFEIAPHQLGIDDLVKNKLLLLKRDSVYWNDIGARSGNAGTGAIGLVVGPMASGASVLADARVADRIKKQQHKNVVGLDMETYGVFAAVNSCDPKVKVLSLKAVCDNGDVKKNDEFQPFASRVSAATVHHFLVNYANQILL